MVKTEVVIALTQTSVEFYEKEVKLGRVKLAVLKDTAVKPNLPKHFKPSVRDAICFHSYCSAEDIERTKARLKTAAENLISEQRKRVENYEQVLRLDINTI